MASLNEQLAALQKAAAGIVAKAKAEGRDLTDDEVSELEAKSAEAIELKGKIDKAEKSRELLQQFARVDSSEGDESNGAKDRRLSFAKTDLTGRIFASMQKTIAVEGEKSLIQNGSTVIPVQLVDGIQLTDRAPLSLLEAFDSVVRSAPTYRFLRETARVNNAGVVAPGAEKATSQFTVGSVVADLRTIAHLSEPMNKYDLSDAPNLKQFVESEMTLGLRYALETEVLSGDGTGEHFTGLSNTSGIQTQTGTDMLANLRAAITKIEVLGQTPKFFALNAVDWATLETTRNTSGNFDFGSPNSAVDRRLWGVPVITTPALAAGTSYLLANGAAVISTDGQIEARWNDSAGELFDFNLLKARVEGRFNLDVLRPSGVVKVTTTAA